MKNKLILFILLLSGLMSCKKDNVKIFDESPDQRLEKVMSAFQKQLVAGNGWRIVANTNSDGVFTFFMKFTDQNRVTMYSDFRDTATGKPRESSYRLKAVQQPILMFDTYNYLHMLMDPDPSLGGSAGVGYQSDIEYVLDKDIIAALLGNSPDTLKQFTLTGRFNKSKITFIKATATEESAYKSGAFKSMYDKIFNFIKDNEYLYIEAADGTKIQTLFNIAAKTITFQWAKNGNAYAGKTGFAFTLDGLMLKTDTLSYYNTRLKNFSWDGTKNALIANIYSNIAKQVQASPTPIIPVILLLGDAYKKLWLEGAANFPGWSADFIARRAQVATLMKAATYNFDFKEMQFVFISDTEVEIYPGAYQGSYNYGGYYLYGYTKNNQNNTIKFQRKGLFNSYITESTLDPLLKQRIDADNFELSYFTDPHEGTLVQFKSVEHADFIFTTYFGNW